jgi:radical SAM superfamily enzyme YgiQ (UPF0313 family)
MGRRRGAKYIRTWQMEPLAPAVLAALTPADVERRFYDDRMEFIPYAEPTDLVAITVETYTARRAYQIASEYRKRGVPVVMGGFHATLLPEEVAEYAEAVVVGAAEGLWPRVINDFRANRPQRIYRHENEKALAGCTPDRSIFVGKKYLPLTLMETGRGCRLGCEFCSIQTAFQSTYAGRPIEEIVAEIRQLNSKFYFFVDDNIVTDQARARELLQALIPLGIKWIGQGGIAAAFDQELLDLLARSGCQGLLIGLESLHPRTLEQMGKGFVSGRDYYERALANLRRHGIRIYATFIAGYDDDSSETVSQAVAFAEEQRFYLTAFNHITPFPGTLLYRRLEGEGRLLYDRWWLDEEYSYGMLPFTPHSISPEELEACCVAARRRFFSYLSMINRSLDFSVNSSSFLMWFNFFVINGLMRREVLQRRRYPLGDEGFRGPVLKVGEALVNTVTMSGQNESCLGCVESV